MSDRKDLAVERKVAARMFRDPDVLAVLDAIEEVGMLVPLIGDPWVRRSWERSGWDDHDPRPALASDDPAVVCAMGRCASFRAARRLGPVVPGHVHPAECGFCDYPTEQLLRALSWATWASGHMESETLVWEGAGGSSYIRPGRPEMWMHPAWAAFGALTQPERTARVLAAVEASRQ